jgi:plastocyanin
MRRVALVLAGVVVLLAGAVLAGRAAAVRPGVTHTVKIDGTRFDPDDLAVDAGDSIEWVNQDPFPHSVTSTEAGKFDSKEIPPGKSWTYKPSHKGTFAYTCTIHPTMKAKLRVK